MAGNVKEWCFNSDGSRRYILGGASTEPKYMYQAPDARPPLDRSATNGFRLAKYFKPGPLPESQTSQVTFQSIDYRNAKPVPDAVFRIYQGLYSYDRTPLDAKIEAVDDSSRDWRRERISFKAAYNDERVIAFLYLPKNVSPPYQTVVHFPGSEAQEFHTFTDLNLFNLDFLMKSGRAVLFPMYKGTYERITHPTTVWFERRARRNHSAIQRFAALTGLPRNSIRYRPPASLFLRFQLGWVRRPDYPGPRIPIQDGGPRRWRMRSRQDITGRWIPSTSRRTSRSRSS